MRSLAVLPFLLLAAAPLAAQGEDQLRDAFEGRSVVVKIDMPATAHGVDVWADERRPLDAADYAERLKRFGTAVKAGTAVMVTKVKVKRDLIEFQLAGGGYGTFGDESGDVYISTPGKSEREKNLEKMLKEEKDPARRKSMEEELDGLRKAREEHDALVRATAATAEAANKQRIQEKALAAGSRFNVRFHGGIPADALTPEGLRRALAQYVDFASAGAAALPSPPECTAADGITPLRKGMSQAQVEALLGQPTSSGPRSENGLQLLRATFTRPEATIVAEFVDSVLVRYTISSN